MNDLLMFMKNGGYVSGMRPMGPYPGPDPTRGFQRYEQFQRVKQGERKKQSPMEQISRGMILASAFVLGGAGAAGYTVYQRCTQPEKPDGRIVLPGSEHYGYRLEEKDGTLFLHHAGRDPIDLTDRQSVTADTGYTFIRFQYDPERREVMLTEMPLSNHK